MVSVVGRLGGDRGACSRLTVWRCSPAGSRWSWSAIRPRWSRKPQVCRRSDKPFRTRRSPRTGSDRRAGVAPFTVSIAACRLPSDTCCHAWALRPLPARFAFGEVGQNSFTYDARRRHGPRQASALIVHRGADRDRLLADAHLLLLGDLLDCAGRTHLTAQHARKLAVADARDQESGPQALDAGFEEGRMERGCSGTPSCTPRSGCSARGRPALRPHPGDESPSRCRPGPANCRCACRGCTPRPRPSRPPSVRRCKSGFVIVLVRLGKKRNLITSSGQAVSQFKQHVALVLPVLDPTLRAIGALAIDQAQIAVRTLGVILLHAEQGEA